MSVGKGYLTLVNILNEFQNARALPNGFDHDILNADTLQEQSIHDIKHAGSNSTTPSWNGHENIHLATDLLFLVSYERSKMLNVSGGT